MKIVNSNTGKTHFYDTKTLKDQHGSVSKYNNFFLNVNKNVNNSSLAFQHPNWLNVGNWKRKIKKKKTAMRKNNFYTGAVLPD